MSGAGFALMLYHRYPDVLVYMTETQRRLAMYRFFNAKSALDIIYNRYLIKPALRGPKGLSQEVSLLMTINAYSCNGIIYYRHATK